MPSRKKGGLISGRMRGQSPFKKQTKKQIKKLERMKMDEEESSDEYAMLARSMDAESREILMDISDDESEHAEDIEYIIRRLRENPGRQSIYLQEYDVNKAGYESISEGINISSAIERDFNRGEISSGLFSRRLQTLNMVTAKQMKRHPESSLARNKERYVKHVSEIQSKYPLFKEKLTIKKFDDLYDKVKV